jgi:hypothetical protein
VTVFVESARRARLHGTKFILKAPPADTHLALHAGGYADLVEVVPRRQPRF